MKPRLSVKTRIAFWLVLAMGVLALVITTVQWFVVEADLRQVLVNQQSTLAHRAAESLDDALRARRDALTLAGRIFTPDMLADPAIGRPVLAQRVVLGSMFDALQVADRNGNVVLDRNESAATAGAPIADRDAVARAIATGRTTIGSPNVSRTTHAPQIVMAAPIVDAGGAVVGALVGTLSLDRDNVLGRLRDQRFGATGRFAVQTDDARALYLMHPNPAMTMRPVPAPDRLPVLATDRDDVIQTFDDQGQPAFVARAALDTVPWTLTATLPLAEAYAGIRTSRMRLVVLGAVLVVSAALLLWALLHRLLQPLQTMRSDLERALASTAPGARLTVEGDAEFAILAQAFNALMDTRERFEHELRTSRAQLRLVIDNVPAIMAYTNRDERIEFAGGQALPGLPEPSQMIGKRTTDVLSPQAYEDTQPHIRAALSGYRERFERIDRRNGRTSWFQIDYVPDIRPDGEVAGFFSLVQDVTETRRVQTSLTDSEQRLRLIADNLPVLISYTDRHMRVIFASAGFKDAYRIDPAAMLGRTVPEILGPEVWAQTRMRMSGALAGRREHFERVVKVDGATRIEQVDYVPDVQNDGSVRGVFGLVQDVTETRRMQSALEENESRIRLITDNLPALICYIDREGIYRFNNRMYEVWLRRPLERITGRPMREVYGEVLYATMAPALDRALSGERVEFEHAFVSDGGTRYVRGEWIPHRDASGAVLGVYGITHDVTPMKMAQQQLHALAQSDTLTGLANRRAFDETIELAVARAAKPDLGVALLIIDVDYFKHINDTYGHAVGDEVLKEFGRRLTAGVRRRDLVARIAGDEFAVVLEGLADPEPAQRIARKIVEAIRTPFAIGELRLAVTTSIGVAWSPPPLEPKRLMREADRALYDAKASGRDTYLLADAPTAQKRDMPHTATGTDDSIA